MSWITIAWSINAGACFVLAGVYFVVWCNQRDSWPHLLFSFSAVASAAIGLIELAMLHGNTVGQYTALIRWVHVPVWVLTLSFVAFVRLYLHAGRRWLAWSIYGVRTLVLIVNFILTPNINFRAITSIRHFSWWGEIVSVPVGVPNPWGLLSNLSLLLLLIFCVDATVTVWRRGDRRRALVVGGSMILGAIVAWHIPLVVWGVIDVPFFLSFAYLGIVLAMGSELGDDMFRAAQLAHKLERSEQRLNLAADSANFGVWEWDLNKDEVSVTPARRELLGLPAARKIRFEHFISRVHADDRDRIRQAIKDAVEKRKVYDSEFRVVLADGSVRWMTARGTVQANKRGKPMRMLGISLDITPRKEAELQGRQQRAELEHLRQQKTALLEKEVVERARLEREVIESCGREQRRIAYDLHDGVGQQLVGIALSAKLLEQELRAEWPAQAKKASAIVRLANETARHTRLTARSLEGADGVGDLKVALEALAAKIRKNCRVAADVKADASSFPVSAPAAAQLYRIVQEALHNAVEHGRARKVQIDLAVDRDNMVLTVRDDGKGFDGSAAPNGMGLRIMRYRAQCIGGSCEVQSNGAQGTIVTCRVPLQADAHVRPIP
ncbi:MAG TPA: PAS domain-containing protein [Candidatus Limnocylindria bacterium]|nr:PAS domain-containing protein [Candidatus Limnocylindria bacterium]